MGFALVIPILLLLIGWEVFRAGWPALKAFGPGFFTSSAWDPVNGNFGAAPAVFGTIVSSILALIIATPLAVPLARTLSSRRDGPALNQLLADTGRLLAVFSLLLSIGLLLS